MKGAWERREARLAATLISDETPMFPLPRRDSRIRVPAWPERSGDDRRRNAGVMKGDEEMLANRWLPPWSLRGRLSATALAGLTTTVVLTALLLLTAWSASEVVDTAQRTHERVRVYTLLQDAAQDYQGNSYAGAHEPGLAAKRSVVEARTRLEHLLA